MNEQSLYLVPGPTKPNDNVLQCYSKFLGSSDTQMEKFLSDYDEVTELLSELLNTPTDSSSVIMVGEGMLGLWSALKNTIKPGDKVISINSGLFGAGIGEMASKVGADVEFFNTETDDVFNKSQWNDFEKLVKEKQPKMITLVHCETPSGSLVSHEILELIGDLCDSINCLFYVDMVSSAGGVFIDLSSTKIDFALLGSQKCFSLHPDLTIMIISKKSWDKIEENKDYCGYDSLLPWKNVVDKNFQGNRLFPYTINWNSILALKESLLQLKNEGFENVFKRHADVAAYCQERVKKMGLQQYTPIEISSPTVTAVLVPTSMSWDFLQAALENSNVFFGGNYGPLAGKVFRIGHMGTQANMELVSKALDELETIIS